MPDTQPDCRCYVRRLTEEARFGLRCGAHALDCPTYHPSRDPIDRAADEDFRREAELERPGVSDDLGETAYGRALRRELGTPQRFDMRDAAAVAIVTLILVASLGAAELMAALVAPISDALMEAMKP